MSTSPQAAGALKGRSIVFFSRRIKKMLGLGPAPCRQWSTSLAFALGRGKLGVVDCHSVVSEMKHLAIEML